MSKPAQILQFHPKFLEKYDHIIFDMDGVVWKSHIFLPGVVETLNALQEVHKKKIFFCTNNSTQHRSSYFPHFEKAGLRFPSDSLYSSASTAASIVFHTMFNGKVPESDTPKVLVIGQPGLHKEFQDYGLGSNVISLAQLRHESSTDLHALRHWQVPKDIECVCSGLQTDFGWGDCAMATMIIRENKAEFIATNCDVTFPSSDTRLLPGAGSVVNMIAGSAGKPPKVMGKPTEFMLKSIQAEHPGIDLSRTLMVGDRLDTDIAFGNNFGMDTMLVMSGVTNVEEYRASVGGFKVSSLFHGDEHTEEPTLPSTPAQVQDDDNDVSSPLPAPIHIPAQPKDPRPTYVANNINDLLKIGALLM